jgi:DNA-binding response OmpR family regulator
MLDSILIVEDQRDLAELAALHLADIAHQVRICGDGSAALKLAQADPPDLVILDLGLPGLDGLEVCRRLRAAPRYIPILMLTARGTDAERVLGLELGADDYLVKPFNVMELVARAKAIVRRMEGLARSHGGGDATPPSEVLQTGALTIEPAQRRVAIGGSEVSLTAKEFDLLLHFARHPGRVYTRGQLLDAVWGGAHDGYAHTVNSHINRLRAKIESDPAQPRYILTVWGVGYKFADDPGAAAAA